ncbi:MAG: 50S ribosomal protein L15 [Candidatus Parcubacteria bacterium]|nr:MAG: 50S ribosomal protein L15 [Candidatus Parcubacteria bacterium]
MLINQINFRLKKKKRIGRGGKKGNYSGRGMKGQRSRAGRRIRPAERDIILKLPKLKGFKFKSFKDKNYVVNLATIDKKFKDGEMVNANSLIEKKIIKQPKSKKDLIIKILSTGQLTKSLLFSNKLLFSKSALNKIRNSNSQIVND